MESMPLAVGYIKAIISSDAALSQDVEMRIENLGGGMSISTIAQRIFANEIPDVLAFSVLGWNYRSSGVLAETFRQLNPTGLVVFGGTHVANQAQRVFRMFPDVDIIANGEGEVTFPNIIRRFLATSSRHDFAGVSGISYKTGCGEVVDNVDQDRITDLEIIPSPFLSGAIPLTDRSGNFRYDVALMETNRGCPYSCSFCYWGGATGQKVRKFSRDRLREELDLFGRLGVSNIVLCDANFAIHSDDLVFIEDFIHVREKYGFPRTLDTSWAKNKSKIFYDIVRRMKHEGLKSSFTLALQSMTESALETMKRKNMKINDWEELVDWLGKEGLDCYAELIWGAPGDNYTKFLEGYDDLARRTSRIAVYPLQVLPNTAYSRDRSRYGFLTVRGDDDDFEYVLGNSGSSLQDNLKMQRFLFWARPIAEHMLFRHIWTPLRVLVGLTQSQVLLRMAAWFDANGDARLEFLRNSGEAIVRAEVVSRVVRNLYRERSMPVYFRHWWNEDIVPLLPPTAVAPITEVFEFDQLCRPIFDENAANPDGLEIVEVDGLEYYCKKIQDAPDINKLCRDIAAGTWNGESPARADTTLYYRVGFHMHVDSHEVAVHFFAKTRDELTSDVSGVGLAEAV